MHQYMMKLRRMNLRRTKTFFWATLYMRKFILP